MRTAVDLKLTELLKQGPQTLKTLAAESKAHEEALGRLLRALSTAGYYQQRKDGSWENNSKSELLHEFRYVVLHQVGQMLPSFQSLTECVRTGNQVFTKTHEGVDFWGWTQKHPEENTVFNTFMSGVTSRFTPMIASEFPWEKFNGRLLVDVAGNYGALLSSILREKCQRSRGILFDLAVVQPKAIEYLAQQGLATRTEFVSGSFFDFVPKGDVLVMKHILHDWSDEKCVEILKNCRKSLAKDGTLVLVELVMPESLVQWRDVFMDLLMMVNFGGKERTLTQWKNLLKMSGFEILKVSKLDDPAMSLSVIETKPLLD